VVNLKERDHLEALGVDVRIILKWNLKECGGRLWTGLIWLRIGPVAGSCVNANELSGSIKDGEFVE
jgi:hypothetical protein